MNHNIIDTCLYEVLYCFKCFEYQKYRHFKIELERIMILRTNIPHYCVKKLPRNTKNNDFISRDYNFMTFKTQESTSTL